ncbi:MAG: hypothetical protein AAF497_14145, partial [Planctomycetota bacterium]
VLFALACGVVLRRHAELRSSNRDERQPSKTTRQFAWPALCLILIGIVAVPELVKNANIEMIMGGTGRRIEVATTSPEDQTLDLDQEIGHMVAALAWQPNHVLGHAYLANLYMARCQQRLFDRLSGEMDTADPNQLWWFASPRYMSIRANEFKRSANLAGLKQLRETEEVASDLSRAYEHFLRSRTVCPFVPRVHFRMAVLEPLLAETRVDTDTHLARATKVASIRPDVLQNVGAVALMSGSRDKGLGWFRKCVECEQGISEELLSLAIPLTTPEEFVKAMQVTDPKILVSVAEERFASDELVLWRTVFAQEAIAVAEKNDQKDGVAARVIGDAYRLLGEPMTAIKSYARAVDEDKSNIDLRFALVVAYENAEMLGDAAREARICVNMMPDKSKYDRALKRIVRKLQKKGLASPRSKSR